MRATTLSPVNLALFSVAPYFTIITIIIILPRDRNLISFKRTGAFGPSRSAAQTEVMLLPILWVLVAADAVRLWAGYTVLIYIYIFPAASGWLLLWISSSSSSSKSLPQQSIKWEARDVMMMMMVDCRAPIRDGFGSWMWWRRDRDLNVSTLGDNHVTGWSFSSAF